MTPREARSNSNVEQMLFRLTRDSYWPMSAIAVELFCRVVDGAVYRDILVPFWIRMSEIAIARIYPLFVRAALFMTFSPFRALFWICSVSLLAALVFGSAHAQAPRPMTFESEGTGGNCAWCSWIAAKGEITGDTAAKLESFIRTQQAGRCGGVRIHSPGGSLVGGIRLGEVFRKYGCSVTVGNSAPYVDSGKPTPWSEEKPGFCFSSCAYALLGGRHRSVEQGSRYGVHQHYVGGKRSEVMLREQAEAESMAIQVLSGLLVEYVMRMGVDPRLITLAALQPDRGNIPAMDRKALEELRVVTDVAPPAAPWTLETTEGTSLLVRLYQPQQNDDEEMALAYCRRSQEDVFFMDISIPVESQYLDGVRDWAKELTEVTFNKSIRVVKVRSGAYKVGGKDKVLLSLAVPRQTLFRIADGQTLEWDTETPSAVRPFFQGTLSTLQLKTFLPILQRNCLPN